MPRVCRHLKDAAKLQLPSEEDDAEAPDGTLGKTVGRMWIDLHGDDADKEVRIGWCYQVGGDNISVNISVIRLYQPEARSCLFNAASLLSFLSPDSALHPEP